MWRSVYITGVVLGLFGAGMEHEKADGTGNLDVIVLSGQSNMAGRGGVHNRSGAHHRVYKEWDGVVPHESWVEKGSILRLNADLEWEEAIEPLHSDIDTGKVCGVGPGLTFGATVSNHGRQGNTLGLVPCAKGGTSITEWVKGSHLYTRMITRTKEAVNKGGALKAVLWYQGESDTLSEHHAKNYKSALETFITNVREDLSFETLPFIQVGITAEHHPHPEFLKMVRDAQAEVRLPGVYYVDAYGLALQEDGIHLTTAAQVELGKKLAASYMSLV